MNQEYLYVFQDLTGFTPHISHLVCMMNFARQETLEDEINHRGQIRLLRRMIESRL
jgi:hypothetical protein